MCICWLIIFTTVIGLDGVDCIYLSKERDKWEAPAYSNSDATLSGEFLD
jgi:hypothetical protein